MQDYESDKIGKNDRMMLQKSVVAALGARERKAGKGNQERTVRIVNQY